MSSKAAPPRLGYSSSRPRDKNERVLSYTMNVTPLDGSVLSTFGTMPL